MEVTVKATTAEQMREIVVLELRRRAGRLLDGITWKTNKTARNSLLDKSNDLNSLAEFFASVKIVPPE